VYKRRKGVLLPLRGVQKIFYTSGAQCLQKKKRKGKKRERGSVLPQDKGGKTTFSSVGKGEKTTSSELKKKKDTILARCTGQEKGAETSSNRCRGGRKKKGNQPVTLTETKGKHQPDRRTVRKKKSGHLVGQEGERRKYSVAMAVKGLEENALPPKRNTDEGEKEEEGTPRHGGPHF